MRLAVLSALLLTGCGTACDAPDGPETGAEDTCNAAAYQSLIGQGRDAGEPLPEPKRIYRIGDPVTMDFNPSRLNIKLDDEGMIAQIDCG